MRIGIKAAAVALLTAVFATGGAMDATSADGKSKPRVTSVNVESSSTISLSTFPVPEADVRGTTGTRGMRFAGKVTFKKVVKGGQRRAKLTRTMKKKARRTCVRLFSGGTKRGRTPKVQVWTHSGPLPAQPGVNPRMSLATLNTRDTVISGAGSNSVLWSDQSIRAASWVRFDTTWYGISPGYPIVAEGGWWDEQREHIRDNSGSFKVRQNGKRTEVGVSCDRFEASTVWNG